MRCLILVCVIAGVAIGAQTCNVDQYSISDGIIGTGSSALRMKVLKNSATGERAAVVWEWGGLVSWLYLQDGTGEMRDVLMHNEDTSLIRSGNDAYAGAMLLPFANRVRNGTYSFNGQTYYLPRNECPSEDRCGALHGFLVGKVLSVVDAVCSDDKAVLTLGFDIIETTHPGYPFVARVMLEYTLRTRVSGGGFDISVEATNAMKEDPLPWTFAWHPYFLVKDISLAVVGLDARSSWNHIAMSPGAPSKGDLIPTGKVESWTQWDGKSAIGGTELHPTLYDDEYKAKAAPTVVGAMMTTILDPLAKYKAVLWADQMFRTVQLFTGAKENWGWSSVAVEPMSGIADSYNNHQQLTILSAGETFRGTFGVYVETAD